MDAKVESNVEISIRNTGKVHIGRNTSINGPNTRLMSIYDGIIIGHYVSIGPDCFLLDYNHDIRFPSAWRFKKFSGKGEFSDYTSSGPTIIGNNVWIGAKTVILPGTNISDNVIIAAGSVVSGNIEGFGLYGGVPAKKIKPIYVQCELKLRTFDWDRRPEVVSQELFAMNDV